MTEALRGGQYQILSVLGVGGFGQTYLAADTKHPDRPCCVIKQFKPTSQDPKFLDVARRLFHTEVTILKRLSQHPQIPDFLDFFEEAGEFYLVQEFIEGHALGYEFSTQGKFDDAQVIAFLQDVLGILEFVHDHQVIHRDIKPGNLIRRQSDGKIVLIDFGAVKEIQTHLTTKVREHMEQTGFTVGIGTQGYSPSEQLAGQPRFCSDLYALGVTAIQAVTRLHPTQLPVNPETGELVWRNYATISSGLANLLDGMVRYHFNQRFQSTHHVLEALQSLTETATEDTEMPDDAWEDTRLLHQTEPQVEADRPPTDLALARPTRAQPQGGTLASVADRPRWRIARLRTLAMASLAATSLVVGMRQLGWLEPLELAAYDQMMRLRPSLAPDPRILVVGISEQDLQTLQRPTPSDRDVAQVIRNLAHHQPRVIGLDLHRELPQEPGHSELMTQLQAAEVVTILKLGDDGVDIPPPPGTPSDRAGFSDIPVDPDGIIRRNLLFASTATESFHSFSVQLALKYLAKQGIGPRDSPIDPTLMQIGAVTFFPLTPNSGSYHALDAAGYQILLDYSAPIRPAPLISFTDALNGSIDPAAVRDKVVLIGMTATSGKDLLPTPYSAGLDTDHEMPGVVLHAQMVSQLLRTVLDGRSIFWFVPEWAEVVWIASWAVLAGVLAQWIRHPIRLGFSMALLLTVLSGTGMLLFIGHGWLPLVAPAVALLLTSMAIVSYRSYQS